MKPTYDDLAQFVRCIAETFPPDITRDRFGRVTGPRDESLRRHLANKHQIGGCVYADEQLGKIALSLLTMMKGS